MRREQNLEHFSKPEVVAYYAHQKALQPSERYLFNKYLKLGMSILDMGVGAGRTTPYLSKIAGRYVGADYAEPMVSACCESWPGFEFRQCDASDMAQFADGEFDAVIFSFNGIDVISTDEARARCLVEAARVLKPGGTLVFSSHNARVLGVWPILDGVSPFQIPKTIARSILKSLAVAVRFLKSGVYATGEGYLYDPAHFGMRSYSSTPKTMAPQLVKAGFSIIEVVTGPVPALSMRFLAPWYYYACLKQR